MKPYTEQSYYELLEVPVTASGEEIRAAYQRAIQLYDADSVALYPVGDPTRVEELRQLLAEAVEVLSDPARRARYDQGLGSGNGVATVHRLEVEPSRAADLPPIAHGDASAWPTFLPRAQPAAISVTTELPAPAPAAMASAEEEGVASAGSGRSPVFRRALQSAPVLAQESAIADAESTLAQIHAQVAHRSREPRARGMEVSPDAVFNGELLRQIRKTKGMTVQVLADRTRISSRHLENVEADRYDALPATVYLRGMLMSIARELGLDALRVSKGYLALVEKQSGRR